MLIPPELIQGLKADVALASAAALKAVVSDITASATGNVKRRLQSWLAEAHLRRLGNRLSDARMVKTLWSFDQRVDLLSFYYPQRLSVGEHEIAVKTLDDLNPYGKGGTRVVVSGRVGLGKTILARYLSVVELTRGDKIPVVIELRRVTSQKSLFAHIKDSLLLLSVHVDSDVLRHLLTQGRVTLFLDGFDEVAPPDRVRIMQQIDRIATKYPSVDMLITSRPDTEIFTLYRFHRADLLYLREADLRPLIFRLIENEAEADRLASEVLKTRRSLVPLLRTPLMVTLLVIAFRTASEVPAIVSDFYSRLFVTLLNRHDKSKPGGFNRPRNCTLSDSKMLELFNTFCLVTLQDGQTEMRRVRAIEACRRAAKACGVEAELAEPFIDDVAEITYLLLREGELLRYAHKSIQEFHAAAFVADAPDIEAQKFYSRVQGGDNLARFAQVLEFLEELDARRFHRFLTIPDAEVFFERLRVPRVEKTEPEHALRDQLIEELEVIVKGPDEFELAAPDLHQLAAQWVVRKLGCRGEVRSLATFAGEGPHSVADLIRRMASSGKSRSSESPTSQAASFIQAVDDVLKALESRIERLRKALAVQAKATAQLLDI
jgi:hypothetical protein